MRRLGGRSVWSRTIGLLPKSRSSELRSLSLHKPQSSYCGSSEIARRLSYKRLKSTSVKIERETLPYPIRRSAKELRDRISHKIRSIHHRRVAGVRRPVKKSPHDPYSFIAVTLFARAIVLIRAYLTPFDSPFGSLLERREKPGISRRVRSRISGNELTRDYPKRGARSFKRRTAISIR